MPLVEDQGANARSAGTVTQNPVEPFEEPTGAALHRINRDFPESSPIESAEIRESQRRTGRRFKQAVSTGLFIVKFPI